MGARIELIEWIHDFLDVARLCEVTLPRDAITPETLRAPHRRPSKLPPGKMAVYVFSMDGLCLKVGKAGPNSDARFTSQHYNPRSVGSNLAKSILTSKDRLKSVAPHTRTSIDLLSEKGVGSWIEKNCTRHNFFMDANLGKTMLLLLEVFLQCRLKPLFEGKAE